LKSKLKNTPPNTISEEFDKIPWITFKHHIKREHYMWDYLFFIASMQEKRITEFSGEESYVFNQFKVSSLEWIPYKKCMSIESGQNFHEEEQQEENQIAVLQNAYKMVIFS
jgi:hypothetical protein